jgi:dihydrofolate synthase/folylpolyglutamate synthase
MDSLDFLFSLERLGMKFGLDNMRILCEALGNPQQRFQSVIVAGTNGKGSVTAMLATALHAAGHRTARYTSPHLERLEERFVIDEREVQSNQLRRVADDVRSAIERLTGQGRLQGPPTFFECTTAIAFELFSRADVAVAVLEVGLGGRLDATNIVTPLAAAITTIDFDHQAQLGDTLDSIAYEKAGVIKDGIPVVIGPLPPVADHVVSEVCQARRARLVRALDRVRIDDGIIGEAPGVTFTTPERRLPEVHLALGGRHQRLNAAIVIAVLEELNRVGVAVDTSSMARGLGDTRWPARLERRRWHDADVLLDAAHNPAGARALADYLRDIGWTEISLVTAALRDKDVEGILAPLLPCCRSLICTTPVSPRALTAAQLAARASVMPEAPQLIETIDDPGDALRRACRPGARVVVAGSIFLVGPLRGILR